MFVLGMVFITPTTASAAGSDSPTPYTVTSSGVKLPEGDAFQAHGHINWRTTLTSGGMHFDPNNNQPGGAYIGKDFFPIELAPGECITWVQISHYNEHFGEGGQAPVCAPEPERPTPDKPAVITGDEQRTSDYICVVPADGTKTATLENRIWTQDFEFDVETWTWIAQKRVYSDWEVADTLIVEDEICNPEEPKEETPEETPEEPKEETPEEQPEDPVVEVKDESKQEVLANTGDGGSYIWIAAALLLLGSIAYFVPIVGAKRVRQ